MSEPMSDEELYEWRRNVVAVRKIGTDWLVRVDDVERLLDEIDRLRAAAAEWLACLNAEIAAARALAAAPPSGGQPND